MTWVRAKQNSGKCGGRFGYWRTRYQKRTFYLKTPVSGKTDRAGYLQSLVEAERLRLYVDGLGPNPYAGNRVKPDEVYERELRAFAGKPSQSLAELVERYLAQRQRAVEAGVLSVQQWAEDSRNLNAFSDWLGEIGIDDLSADKLNRYRDHMQDSCNSPATLRKRLATPAKFIRWLVDESVIDRPPRDLETFAWVENGNRKKVEVFTVAEIKMLYEAANEPMRLYILLALNTGATQKDVSTLEAGMIDWENGFLNRPRHKTQVATQFKLWPITLRKLKEQLAGDSPLLLNSAGNPLLRESTNAKGTLIRRDTIREAFGKLVKKVGISGRSFKHLRKTSADLIEQWDSSLTSLFLGHVEGAVKKAYVNQHFEKGSYPVPG